MLFGTFIWLQYLLYKNQLSPFFVLYIAINIPSKCTPPIELFIGLLKLGKIFECGLSYLGMVCICVEPAHCCDLYIFIIKVHKENYSWIYAVQITATVLPLPCYFRSFSEIRGQIWSEPCIYLEYLIYSFLSIAIVILKYKTNWQNIICNFQPYLRCLTVSSQH